eukprot:754286-Hanusia_phi.AAC.5
MTETFKDDRARKRAGRAHFRRTQSGQALDSGRPAPADRTVLRYRHPAVRPAIAGPARTWQRSKFKPRGPGVHLSDVAAAVTECPAGPRFRRDTSDPTCAASIAGTPRSPARRYRSTVP